jgi:xanthine dehydrogenase accessory factor
MNIYQMTNKFINEGTPIVVISVIEKVGEGPVEVGKKLLLTVHNEAFGTVGGGALEYSAREYCKTIFSTKKSETKTYLLNEGKVLKDATTLPMVCGGKVTLFFEYIGPNEYIYIFGAGHVGQALTNVLKTMNYHITVIDERKEVIDQFKGGDEVILSPFANYIEENGLQEDSFIVVCTPSHKYDYNVIDKVIEKKIKLKYLGMLCSPQKLQDYLTVTYDKFSKNIDLSNFYSPIGLDTGGGSPEEIAISIASEILVVSNKKTGHKHMRETTLNGTHRYWED